MNSLLIDRILPIYHCTSKKRHDLLCSDLSNNSALSDVSIREIDLCVQEIEELISKSINYAREEFYGQITRKEALKKISGLSPLISSDSLNIIMERANYYARK